MRTSTDGQLLRGMLQLVLLHASPKNIETPVFRLLLQYVYESFRWVEVTKRGAGTIFHTQLWQVVPQD